MHGEAEHPDVGADFDGARNGGVRLQQFPTGFAKVGSLAKPGSYPIMPRADAELPPKQFSISSKWRNTAGRAAASNPHEGALGEDALGQVDIGWLDGPFPFGLEGRLITARRPRRVNPAFRYGSQHGWGSEGSS